MGDFNINLLASETCKHAQKFLFSLQSLGLMPTIDKATRVYKNTATLIDNIFINNFDDNLVSGNIVSDISDHYSQCSISQFSMPLKQKSSPLKGLYAIIQDSVRKKF
jgi:hypothetical protein